MHLFIGTSHNLVDKFIFFLVEVGFQDADGFVINFSVVMVLQVLDMVNTACFFNRNCEWIYTLNNKITHTYILGKVFFPDFKDISDAFKSYSEGSGISHNQHFSKCVNYTFFDKLRNTYRTSGAGGITDCPDSFSFNVPVFI